MKPGLKILIYSAILTAVLIAALSTLSSISSRYTYLSNYRKGYTAFLEGRFSESSPSLQKAADTYPEYTKIIPLLAASYFYEGDFQKAGRLFSSQKNISAQAGEIISNFTSIHKAGRVTPEIRESYALKLKGVDSSDPNIIANAAALSCSPELSAEERSRFIAMIKNNVLNKKEVYHQCLSLAYNTLGCLLFYSGEFTEASDSFASAGLFSVSGQDIEHFTKNRLSIKLAVIGKTGNKSDSSPEELISILSHLKGDELFTAQMTICSDFLKKGLKHKVLEILETCTPKTPIQEITRNQLHIELLRKDSGGFKGDLKRIQIIEILKQSLDTHSRMDVADQRSGSSNALFHQAAGYFYIDGRFAEFEEHLYKAIALFPDDPGFKRNLGIYLFNKGERSKGLGQIKKSLVLDPNQPDLVSVVADLEAKYFISSLSINTNPPFSIEHPLISFIFGKNPLQNNPVVRSMSVAGRQLNPVVTGNTVSAVLTKKMSSDNSGISISLELVNPDTEEISFQNITSTSDLIPPKIKLNAPARNSKVVMTGLKLDLELSDAHSGIDLSTLDVQFQEEKPDKERKGFIVPIIRNGIYRSEKELRAKQVTGDHVICTPLIPIPGTYILTVTVRDLKGNKSELTDFRVTVTP